MKPAQAQKLLSEMADAGDVDRFYPPNEEGKRGRSKAVYRKMTDERLAELAPHITAREAVSHKLAAFTSSNVTLSRVTLSLADACALLGVEPLLLTLGTRIPRTTTSRSSLVGIW